MQLEDKTIEEPLGDFLLDLDLGQVVWLREVDH